MSNFDETFEFITLTPSDASRITEFLMEHFLLEEPLNRASGMSRANFQCFVDNLLDRTLNVPFSYAIVDKGDIDKMIRLNTTRSFRIPKNRRLCHVFTVEKRERREAFRRRVCVRKRERVDRSSREDSHGAARKVLRVEARYPDGIAFVSALYCKSQNSRNTVKRLFKLLYLKN